MSINIQVYSNANSASRSINFEFVGDILAADDTVLTNVCTDFYFKISTSAKQDNNVAFPVKVVTSLSDLVLNKQKQRGTNTANAYGDIKSMIVDYTYDYINGHSANLYGSSCTAQRPMKFA